MSRKLTALALALLMAAASLLACGDSGASSAPSAGSPSASPEAETEAETTTPIIEEITAGKNLGDIEDALSASGYGWVDWTVDSGDSWGKDKASPELIMKQVKKAAKDQKIMVVLCHEWSKDTEKALPEMIEYLEGQGYIFLPMFYESQTVYK